MDHKKKCACFLLLIFLVGCTAPAALPEPTVVSTDFASPAPIILLPAMTVEPESFIPSPDLTQVTTSPTPTCTPSATPITETTFTPAPPPEARIEYQCLEIVSEPPQAGLYNGKIVLSGYQDTPSILFDLSTGLVEPIASESGTTTIYETVSSDRIWLAYKLKKQDWLVMESLADEETSLMVDWQEDWTSVIRWLDEQRLLIGKQDAYLVFNPFTFEQETLKLDFPDLGEPIGVGADWWGSASFNRDLSRAVYPSEAAHPTSDGDYGRIILWNLQTGQAITALKSENNPYGGEPVWSSSGDEFVIFLTRLGDLKGSLGGELYRVTKDGVSSPITNLSPYYSKWLTIFGYSWAPDDSKIAFRITGSTDFDPVAHFDLAVINLKTYQVTNYCIDGLNAWHAPVWSPDGSLLVVEANVEDENVILMIDPATMKAFRIAGLYEPIGWVR